jgi:hypothetical protein
MAAGEAERVALALEARRAGRGGWLAFCPAHDNKETPALSIKEGQSGMLLVHCFSGCDARDVLAALRQRGIISGRYEKGEEGQLHPSAVWARERERAREAEDKLKRVRWFWGRAESAERTLVQTYLEVGRGLPLHSLPQFHEPEKRRFKPSRRLVPAALRFRPKERHLSGADLPVMVALVTKPDGGICGLHRTFLASDGSRKAAVDPVRMMFGPVSGGAVHLAPAAEQLGFAEGIETALAFMIATGVPTWATLSTSGMARAELPPLPFAREVIIAADNDPAGVEAAEKLAARAVRDGRRVRIATPPAGLDFADLLTDDGALLAPVMSEVHDGRP